MVALLDKDDGSQRPLSIASALWRIGATSLVRQMAPWIECWAPAELAGGPPDRAAVYIHGRIAQTFNDKHKRQHFGAIFEDLSRAFDNVDIGQCLAIWEALGAPQPLLRLIRDFYRKARRLFTSRGWCTHMGQGAALPPTGMPLQHHIIGIDDGLLGQARQGPGS